MDQVRIELTTASLQGRLATLSTCQPIKVKTAAAHHNCGIFGSTLFKLTYLSEAMSISKFTKTAGLAVAVGLTVLATNLNILFSPFSKINLTVL